MVRAVPVLVVPTMVYVAVDVSLAPGVPELPSPLLATTVAMPVPAAQVSPVASSGIAAPASAVAPLAAAVFAVAVAPAAPAALRPSPAPVTPVSTPVALPVVPSAAAVSLSSRDAMVRNEKDGLIAIYMFN